MIWALANWRLILAGTAVVAGIVLFGLWRHEHDVAEKAKAAERVATSQSHIEQATTKAVDTYHERTVILRDRADHAIQAVQSAPGADQRLPDDVRRLWLDGLHDLAGTADDQPSR